MDIVEFNGYKYPAFQAVGGASLFVRHLAQQVCKGRGVDVGYSKEEWKFPGSIGVEPAINPEFDAMNLPDGLFDYIHQSHQLEHVENSWVDVLEYWQTKLKPGGVLFMYFPDFTTQLYWRGWAKGNRKHKHCFTPEIIRAYLTECGYYRNVFVSGIDAYNSFTSISEKI